MSTEHQESPVEEVQRTDDDAQMKVEEPEASQVTAPAVAPRKRPRLDLTAEPKERKRGKSMFGLVLGTLNKAKNEDKARNSSEAAKKRQLIEQRLQEKLRKETDSVRRAEEAKKDKTVANRKEEDLQLKDSIHKLRHTNLPLLANFLCTSDSIPTSDPDSPSESDQPPSRNVLSGPPRSHPPPIYYLPAVLTPAQEAFLVKRKAEVKEAAEQEWATFRLERSAGIEEIQTLRQRVQEEQLRVRVERGTSSSPTKANGDQEMQPTDSPTVETKPAGESGMDVDQPPVDQSKEESSGKDEEAKKAGESTQATEAAKVEEKETVLETAPVPAPVPMQADDDDAVEY
ncbi:uncharacterized protein STEHIDRAFT_162476 [Stereum hirsutum FP-91666 SS1]|uniref:uncharacterized protein n=1 Tax=Stereum hirsutum (strain FP-91666) TaxID=721885 RepID=UPI000444955E|nr:uncharacterized protein STEHIDRAFT_162476 [Stereum hirsutum FP-91666 SS1]EIM80698.1 hypothetical protein STEHIDRAFT_162476 [Stereum hirsutum FP-91666 SS1]